MKKLSIEEKAKAYDEAIEKAKAWCACEHATTDDKILLKRIFPELAESEDERIRKALRERIIRYDPNNEILIKEEGISQKQFIAWLEKQAEQKPADKVEPKWKPTDKDIFELQCVINNDPYNGFILKALLEQLKKLKED